VGITVTEIQHLTFYVTRAQEAAAKEFYGRVLGLPQIPKPLDWQAHGGAWYQFGSFQMHLSLGDEATVNPSTSRHICIMVADLAAAEAALRAFGAEIIPDKMPFDQWKRFYTRDPGGNCLEIAQRLK
jgi:predicted enzyme related to lactoylglutathione lyase